MPTPTIPTPTKLTQFLPDNNPDNNNPNFNIDSNNIKMLTNNKVENKK